MKKLYARAILIIVILFIIGAGWLLVSKMLQETMSFKEFTHEKAIKIDKIVIQSDKDKDGVLDSEDFMQGARAEVKNKTKYISQYYVGGYPPDSEGVCTDVIWRAFKSSGYNLKDMVDKDIKDNVKIYQRVGGKPDPNIDFRRVPNLEVFFGRFGEKLTTDIIPKNVENLKQWQGGDVVTFKNPEHIAFVSDKRRKDGVPYLIHNPGPRPAEDDKLMKWSSKITGHFRYPLIQK
jgi:uncharacterized protein YijF (DUF1287 family)